MIEKSTPVVLASLDVESLGDLPVRAARRDPTRATFSVHSEGSWRPVTATEFAAEVARWAKGLIAHGIGPGDRVGVLSRTRYEWTVADFALWTIGAVPVPIYETSSPEQVEWILSDSEAVAAIVEHTSHAATVAGLRDRLPALREVWTIDEDAAGTLADTGRDIGDEALGAAREGLTLDSVATIIYTSGTTGRPKGVELTHGNFLLLAENATAILGDVLSVEDAATLLFLPLAHVFARFIEVLCVAAGARLGHSPEIKNLLDDLAGFRPTFVLAVPRVFEKIYNTAEVKAQAGGKGRIFAVAAATATAWSEAKDTGKIPLGLAATHAVFDRLVYGKLREAMGGQVRYAVSGGAPLGTRLGHFFRGVGVTILEGYGLTETTAPVSVNLPDSLKIGTVGPPLPGTSIRIDDDGEILLKGVGVFRRYHGNEEATREAISDSWFHSGDVGELDGDGFLRITGRKKEILVTAGGKNVAPAVLEDRLRAHPLISQCMVVGDGRPYIGALLTLDAEMLPLWAETHDLPGLTVATARQHPRVLEELQHAVDAANKAVSQAESIRKFSVLDTDFTEASGHLTPSLKLRRSVVMRDFGDEVDALYGA